MMLDFLYLFLQVGVQLEFLASQKPDFKKLRRNENISSPSLHLTCFCYQSIKWINALQNILLWTVLEHSHTELLQAKEQKVVPISLA